MESHQDRSGNKPTVRIKTRFGKATIAATYITGHFAVHRTSVSEPKEYDGTWTVTHIPTGRSVTTYCLSEANAREIADWVRGNFEQYGVDAAEADPLAILTGRSNRQLWCAINPRLVHLWREYLLFMASKTDT